MWNSCKIGTDILNNLRKVLLVPFLKSGGFLHYPLVATVISPLKNSGLGAGSAKPVESGLGAGSAKPVESELGAGSDANNGLDDVIELIISKERVVFKTVAQIGSISEESESLGI